MEISYITYSKCSLTIIQRTRSIFKNYNNPSPLHKKDKSIKKTRKILISELKILISLAVFVLLV